MRIKFQADNDLNARIIAAVQRLSHSVDFQTAVHVGFHTGTVDPDVLRLAAEDNRVLVWLLWQRFLYRQLMYAVLLKSLKTAVSGIRAGWGKLERKGTVAEPVWGPVSTGPAPAEAGAHTTIAP